VVKSQARVQAARFSLVVAAIAVITATDLRLHVNVTTVALTFLIAVLLASAYWGLRYALVLALGAAAAFNFYFLPPVGSFRILYPQDWVAFFAFLTTALVASNLEERARRDAGAAKHRRREAEQLYELSQRFLASENELELLNALPLYVKQTFSVRDVCLVVAGNPSLYRSSPGAAVDENLLRLTLLRGEPAVQNGTAYIPLRLSVHTVGALAVSGYDLSRETLDALGSLTGLALERARALEALSKNHATQENQRLQSALLDSVTHELHTALTTIKRNITTLLNSAGLDDQGKRALLTGIDEQTDRLNRMVDEAAEMSQLDSGNFKLDLGPHAIQEALQPALQDAKAAIEKHPVEVALPPDLPLVRVDLARMREVLMHLLDNAGKYSSPGTPIKITAEVKSDFLVISVADRGVGIDSFEQTLIFDKFYRGGRQRYTSPGAGMGLPIAKVIIAAHGGSIAVVSQLGSGSVFSVSIPIYVDHGASRQTPAAAGESNRVDSPMPRP
jgi:two-component system, OmpR family, sensor histidine kinase KdpD